LLDDEDGRSGRDQYLEVPDGKLCYDLWWVDDNEKNPLMYLPCLNREKNEAKAANLRVWCRQKGHTYLAHDYYGVRRSSGDFADGTITRWVEDSIRIIEQVLEGRKAIVVGAGVGGWVGTVLASKRPDLVAALVGIAADPDFTVDLLEAQLPEETLRRIKEDGICNVEWGKTTYPISRKLLEDGRDNLVLRGDPGSLKIKCPVRLVHGIDDEEVPYETALRLASMISHNDVTVTLIKGSEHAMEDEEDFKKLRHAVEDALTNVYEYDLRTPASG